MRGAVMRWPSPDHPGAGGKVRGVTGPSSSTQRIVAPSGGSVERVTIGVLLGQSPDQRSWPTAVSAASGPAPPTGCVAPDCAPPGCLGIGRPPPAPRAYTPATATRAQTGAAPRPSQPGPTPPARLAPQPIHATCVEGVDALAHRLHV